MTSPETALRSSSPLGLSGSVAAVCCWSAGNIMVVEVPMSGLQIAFWRILLGAVVYSSIVYATGRRLDWVKLRAVAPAGIAISLEIALFFVAIRNTTVANTTVLGALAPIVLLGVASRRFGERVTTFLVVVSGVALVGVVMVILGSSESATWSPKGDALAFAAMVFFAAYFVYAKQGRQTVEILEFQACLWITGAITLAPVAAIEVGGVDWPSWTQWAWLCALLAVPGTGHMLMNWSHAHVRLVVASMLSLGLPVLSTIGAVIFLDESVHLIQVGGMILAVGALTLVVRREAQLVSA